MSDFSQLSDSLDKMLDQLHLKKTFQQSQAIELWDDVVGEKLASKTEPVKIEHGKLIIKVSSPVWRNELQFHKEKIKSDLNDRLGKQIVRTIIFT
ncbi:MAG: DUF721 domain-containing protein [Candidatus Marinimicrobia bacterium]|nr:DUF721 domain-containing protein [Candidatus Neomarinimicrobiota bacterium]